LHCNLYLAFQELLTEDVLKKSESFDDEVLVREAEKFRSQCPAYDEHYANQKNSDTLLQWLSENILGVTAANLFKAFHACVGSRRILPAKTGFNRADWKSKLGPGEIQLRAEEAAKARELADGPATDSRNSVRRGVTDALARKYQESLQKAHDAAGASPRELRDARFAVSAKHPLMDVRCREFASLVSAEILNRRS
jgi:hypothetical protein